MTNYWTDYGELCRKVVPLEFDYVGMKADNGWLYLLLQNASPSWKLIRVNFNDELLDWLPTPQPQSTREKFSLDQLYYPKLLTETEHYRLYGGEFRKALVVVKQWKYLETSLLDFYRELGFYFRLSNNYFPTSKPLQMYLAGPNVALMFTNYKTMKQRCEEKPLTMDDVFRFSLTLALALLNLFHNGYIHADLQAENCLVDQNDNIVVRDFGLARNAQRYKHCKKFYVHHAAPELFTFMERKETPIEYDPRMADIYAFGFTMWQFLNDCKSRGFFAHSENLPGIHKLL